MTAFFKALRKLGSFLPTLSMVCACLVIVMLTCPKPAAAQYIVYTITDPNNAANTTDYQLYDPPPWLNPAPADLAMLAALLDPADPGNANARTVFGDMLLAACPIDIVTSNPIVAACDPATTNPLDYMINEILIGLDPATPGDIPTVVALINGAINNTSGTFAELDQIQNFFYGQTFFESVGFMPQAMDLTATPPTPLTDTATGAPIRTGENLIVSGLTFILGGTGQNAAYTLAKAYRCNGTAGNHPTTSPQAVCINQTAGGVTYNDPGVPAAQAIMSAIMTYPNIPLDGTNNTTTLPTGDVLTGGATTWGACFAGGPGTCSYDFSSPLYDALTASLSITALMGYGLGYDLSGIGYGAPGMPPATADENNKIPVDFLLESAVGLVPGGPDLAVQGMVDCVIQSFLQGSTFVGPCAMPTGSGGPPPVLGAGDPTNIPGYIGNTGVTYLTDITDYLADAPPVCLPTDPSCSAVTRPSGTAYPIGPAISPTQFPARPVSDDARFTPPDDDPECQGDPSGSQETPPNAPSGDVPLSGTLDVLNDPRNGDHDACDHFTRDTYLDADDEPVLTYAQEYLAGEQWTLYFEPWVQEQWIPTLKRMTAQMHASIINQTRMLGATLDGIALMRSALRAQQQELDAKMSVMPSENSCVAGSAPVGLVRTLSASHSLREGFRNDLRRRAGTGDSSRL
ncbi:MAG: hypothetical protein OXT65_12155 [Alphaproteobacteria bacterium]|nr:hypothetical protein [Alphaproteobacteria bacterium]